MQKDATDDLFGSLQHITFVNPRLLLSRNLDISEKEGENLEGKFILSVESVISNESV